MPYQRIDPASFDVAALRPAVDWLQSGRIVAFPTDTFYGYAVDPRSPAAVRALFALKGRPAGMALPLVVGSREQAARCLGALGDAGNRLAERFWPGPLSLLCDAPGDLDPAVHAGSHAVAVRVPDHPIARALALLHGSPITATSANETGKPPVDRADALVPDAERNEVFVLDGGITPGGAPSTIVDARSASVRLVRAGAIAWDRVLESLQA